MPTGHQALAIGQAPHTISRNQRHGNIVAKKTVKERKIILPVLGPTEFEEGILTGLTELTGLKPEV
ncbi:MAG TPA: hypothetical protein VG167_18605 [Verrucomicrobiae bacterium]|nr:hypothetical protein [Verrucomicrobiae bacterium]